jgi:hypothetical protein
MTFIIRNGADMFESIMDTASAYAKSLPSLVSRITVSEKLGGI